MKFVFRRASEFNKDEEVEINTLTELLKLIDEEGCDIIVGTERSDGKRVLIVYDDYME